MRNNEIKYYSKSREQWRDNSFIEKCRKILFDFEDIFFEFITGCEFSGVVKSENLIAENKVSLEHATAYQAVWCRNLRELFKESSKTEYFFDNFIDIGSGKGKACFYANSKNNFSQVIGVEFSKPLVDIAEKNKKIIATKKVVFINTDATTYELPNQKNLVFLFNPFDNVMLEKFLLNNKRHFEKNSSIIAYANDVHRVTLTKLGFETIYRNQTRKISLYQFPRSA